MVYKNFFEQVFLSLEELPQLKGLGGKFFTENNPHLSHQTNNKQLSGIVEFSVNQKQQLKVKE